MESKTQLNKSLGALSSIISTQIGEDIDSFTMVYDLNEETLKFFVKNKTIESGNAILKGLIKAQLAVFGKKIQGKIYKIHIDKNNEESVSLLHVRFNNGRKEIININELN